MKKWMYIWIAVSALAVAGAFFGGRACTLKTAGGKANSQGAPPPAAGPAEGGMAPMMIPYDDPDFQDDLKLTDDQITKLGAIADKYRGAGKNTPGSMRPLRQDLNNLIEADNPDLKSIDAKIDEITAGMGEAQRNNAHMMVEMRGILTQAQREKLQYAQQKFMQRNENEGRRPGGRGGNRDWGGRGRGGRGGGNDQGGQ